MSKWGLFTHCAEDDCHVIPVDEEGFALNAHTLDVECWCAPRRDQQEPSVLIHNDPSLSLH